MMERRKKRKRNRIGVVVDGKKVYIERDLPSAPEINTRSQAYEVLAECQQSMPGWTWEHVLSALQEKVADLVEEDQVNIAPPKSVLNGQHLPNFRMDPATSTRILNRLTNLFALPRAIAQNKRYFEINPGAG